MNNINRIIVCNIMLSVVVLLFSCSKDDNDVLEPIDTYVKYYGNSYVNEAYEMIETSDGGFILAGKTENAISKKSVFVVKVAANGNEEWSRIYDNTLDEEAKHIANALDGGYILASTQIDNIGNQTIFLTKINSTGIVSWKNSYYVNDSTTIEKVIPTSDNGYLMLANTIKADATNNNPSGKSDILLVKTDLNGVVMWSRQYGGVNDDYGYDLEEKASNGYIVVGSTTSFSEPNQAQQNAFVVEVNLVGTEVGKFTYGGTSNDRGNEIEVVSDGYLICGETQSNGSGSSDVYYFKIGLNIYTVLFEKVFGGGGIDIGNCVTAISSGEFLIGGTTESFGNGLFDSYLIKVDASGNEVFSKTYGGVGEEKINDIINLNDNKILLLGTNSLGGNQMISLTKTKEDGELN